MKDNRNAFDRLRVFQDGDAYYVTLDDFIDLQQSPALFYGPDDWQSQILRRWWRATPLIHLPLVELIRVAELLEKEGRDNG